MNGLGARWDGRMMKRIVSTCAVLVVIVVSYACVSESESPDETATLSESTCSTPRDVTDPRVTALLDGAAFTPSGDVQTRRAPSGEKISTLEFQALVGDEPVKGTLTCTSSCNGNFCGGMGCDPWGSNCSTFTCTHGCTGSCSKKVTVELDP